MNEAIELYNNIMGLEIDMILNPDIYVNHVKRNAET